MINYNEKLDNPVLLIRQLRHTFPVRPNCFHFAKLLTDIYPNSRIYYNSQHCITRIYDEYYDFDGVADSTGYLPLSDFYSPQVLSDLFTKEFNKEYYLDRFYSDYQDGDVIEDDYDQVEEYKVYKEIGEMPDSIEDVKIDSIKSHQGSRFVNPTCDCVSTTENGSYVLTCKNQINCPLKITY